MELAWSANDNSITIRKADSNALTTVQTEAIIAVLRYAHGDADNAGEGERVFTFVLRDTAGNVTALNQQVGRIGGGGHNATGCADLGLE